MNKIVSLALITLFLAASSNAEPSTSPVSGMIISKTKIADLEKLVAEGKARKKAEGAYVLPDKFILNGKEHPKTQYGWATSSQNSEYFLFSDTSMTLPLVDTIKLFDKTAHLIWEKKSPGGGKDSNVAAMISNKGNVFFLYETWGSVFGVGIVDKSGRDIDAFSGDNLIRGVIVENLYDSNFDAQFAQNSEMLFTLAYSRPEQLALLGIDVTGEIKFFEKVNPSMKRLHDWYVRVYFNPRRNQVLIDSSGIGEDPPMLSCWSFPQKKVFNKKTVKSEVIYNAAFADNDDILLLVRKKDGSKVVRRLSPAGKEKYERSDVKKMDAQELILSKEKPLNVRSLARCETESMYGACK